MTRLPISFLLPTYNCADRVSATLDSIQWADEILIVDSYSDDNTLEICCKYGARIIQHEYINSAKQKNWALPQCKHAWVFQIDSDEVLSPESSSEIEEAIAAASDDIHAFRMPRRNHMLGRWVQYGGTYPDFQIRLMRRDQARWREREVHAHIMVSGKIGELRTSLIHFDIPYVFCPLRNLDRYTRYEADELVKSGVQFRWHHLVIRPLGAFLHRYFWLQGFREGWRGLIISFYWSAYVFFTRAKLWEIKEFRLEKSPTERSTSSPKLASEVTRGTETATA